MTTSVAEAGEVIVEGEHLGRIEGFRFVPDATEGADGPEGRAERRVARVAREPADTPAGLRQCA